MKLLAEVHSILAIPANRTDRTLVGFADDNSRGAVEHVLVRDLGWVSGPSRDSLVLFCRTALSKPVTLPPSAVTLHAESAVRVMGKGHGERCLPLWKQAAQDLHSGSIAEASCGHARPLNPLFFAVGTGHPTRAVNIFTRARVLRPRRIGPRLQRERDGGDLRSCVSAGSGNPRRGVDPPTHEPPRNAL